MSLWGALFSTDAKLSVRGVRELVLSLGVKVFRRAPNPPPDARERALARLAVRPNTHVPAIRALDEDPHDHTGQQEERDDEVRGGRIPERVQIPSQRPSGASQAQPATSKSPGLNQSPGTIQSRGAEGSPDQPLVVVYVVGTVRHPGLVRAPAGSRAADVLALADGQLPGVDLTTLNLARQVTDCEQIIVGRLNQPPPTNPPAIATSAPTTAPSAPVNLNAATLDQLDALSGVGPVLAQCIVDYRAQNGLFTTIVQLQEFPGVGPEKFDSFKRHVRL